MYVVIYKGNFGFIKPWTAVRDGKTYSQQFLTPSIIEGIEKKIFPEMLPYNGIIKKIVRHKLNYSAIDVQKEQTQPRGWNIFSKNKIMTRARAILERGIMIYPILYLAFDKLEDAEAATKQHICLCRNEDIMLPESNILHLSENEFNTIDGFELRFGESEQSFLVGYNRFDDCKAMYGWLEISGKPVLNVNE
jgi:hypothetical protein